mgnify:CR=1 FL=1
MKNNKKGFVGIGIIIAIIAVLVVGGVAYYAGIKNNPGLENTIEGNDYQPAKNYNQDNQPAPLPAPKVSLMEKIKIIKDDFSEKEVQFLNEDGSILKIIKLLGVVPDKGFSSTQISENKKCVITNTLKGFRDEKGWNIKSSDSIIFNDKGEELWSFKNKFFISTSIAPNCNYVVGEIYDGDSTGPVFLVTKDGFESEHIRRGDQGSSIGFSEDGSWVVLGISNGLTQGLDLIAFNENGKILWRKEKLSIGNSYIREIIISSGVVSVSVDTYSGENPTRKVYTFDKAGNIVNL